MLTVSPALLRVLMSLRRRDMANAELLYESHRRDRRYYRVQTCVLMATMTIYNIYYHCQ